MRASVDLTTSTFSLLGNLALACVLILRILQPVQTVKLARHAMATRFELVLHGENASSLRAAGEEALAEVNRIENQLSLYRPGSEIAQVNARAAREDVLVSPEVFSLLQHAAKLSDETGGAFDITIAPLVRCWGFMGANGKMPSPEDVAEAIEKVGMRHVQLDVANRTVRFAREGVMLDLGAIGKGYAVERGVEILREAGVTSALFHGGTSTVYAVGHPPEAAAWKVAFETPPAGTGVGSSMVSTGLQKGDDQMLSRCVGFSLAPSEGERAGVRGQTAITKPAPKVWQSDQNNVREPSPSPCLSPHPQSLSPSEGAREVSISFPKLPDMELHDEAMSVSAVWGRSFQSGEQTFGHVIDPRTGQPVKAALLSAVVLPSATETDALSTALLTLGQGGHEIIRTLRPAMRSLVVDGNGAINISS